MKRDCFSKIKNLQIPVQKKVLIGISRNIFKSFGLSLFVLVLSCISAYSQNVEKYSDSMNEVYEYLLENEYSEALYILNDLENQGYQNANMDYLIGLCNLKSQYDKSKAVSYLKKVTGKISPAYDKSNPDEINVPVEVLLYLGDAYLAVNNVKDARVNYLKYVNSKYTTEIQKDEGRARIKNTLFARLQLDNPIEVNLENAGVKINNGIANSNPCISASGRSLVFLKTLKFYDGLYFTTKSDSGWLDPVSILTQVGSDGEFVPTALSPDGTKILFKTFVPTMGYDIFESTFNGRKWTKVKKLPTPLNSNFNETDANYGPDGKTIYFSSNRSGGFGGYDIYKATPDSTGNTYSVQNLGDGINSAGNEKSPSILNNGKVLVFSSDFKISIGDVDYYYSQYLGPGKWSEPLNLGYPLNTTSVDDDIRFTALTPNQGVLSRYQKDSHTQRDIYFFKSPVFSSLRLVPISGKLQISDTTGLMGRNISLAVFDEETKDTACVLTPNNDGTYFTELYPGKFKLFIKENNKLTQQDFSISNEFKEDNYALVSNIEPEKPKVETIAKIDSIFISDVLFNFNEFEISTQERALLDASMGKLKNFPLKSVKLLGYTDIIGDDNYNKILSEKRAQAVKEYLIKLGYNESVITVEGKGSCNFVAKNIDKHGYDNPVGRSYNRRVYILIEEDSPTLVIVNKSRVPSNLEIAKP